MRDSKPATLLEEQVGLQHNQEDEVEAEELEINHTSTDCRLLQTVLPDFELLALHARLTQEHDLSLRYD